MARRYKSPGRRLYELGESMGPVFLALIILALLGRFIEWLVSVIRAALGTS